MQKRVIHKYLNLIMLDVLKLSFVSLSVGAASGLVENLRNLPGIDQIVDLIAGFTPVALAGTLFLDIVRCLTKVSGMGKIFWVRSSLVFCPFVSSGHDVVRKYM